MAPLDGFPVDQVTTTGWLADQACAAARAKSGTYTPTNPDCAMQCIDKGEKMVLIAEKEKAVYVIDNPDVARDHFAEHLQITGTLDRAANRLHVVSLKDLGDYQGPACARPKRSTGTK
jgi:hypothetical protein